MINHTNIPVSAPVLSPVRWWRDDATRYQMRPPFAMPITVTPEFSAELDAIASYHAQYHERERAVWHNVVPLEFERLEPVPWSAEQDAELQRQLANARDAGWRPEEIKPVLLLCTIGDEDE